ncbi:unnamed protein product [Coregonus sp. 'balchen']|nr:unnamed protein product [Coregonus sp. 'balchen']
MFSALKKLVGTEPGQPGNKNIPAGLQSMNQSLQRSENHHPRRPEHGKECPMAPTTGEEVSGRVHPHTRNPATDDVVKVEVWDVVDKGKGKKRGEMLKTENEPQENETEMALDAEFLDVYKNCNGVIMMFDITKQWTFDYIVRELPKVPTHVPICVLGNQRDMGEHRVILPDDTREFLCHLNRPPGSSYIHYAESSMKNGFGLKYLHRFFNIPFLQLQMMEARNKAGFSSPGGPSNGQSPSSGSQSPIVPQSGPSTPGACPSPCTPQQPPLPPQPLTISNPTPRPVQGPPSYTNPILNPCPPLQNTALPRGPGYPQQPPNPQGPHHGGATPVPTPQSPNGPGEKVRNVDDFVPDVGMGRSFLEEGAAAKAKEKARKAGNMDSDSDGEGRGGNPMVSGFQDDFAPDELCQSVPKSVPKAAAVPSMGITLTSDEEDEGTKALNVIQDGGSDRRRSSSNALKTQNKTGEAKKPAALKMSSEPVSFLNPTPAPVQSMRAGKKKGGDESSHSGQEAPVANQMLSFVMDEPDCEDKEFEKPKKKKEPSVVLEYLEPVKPSVLPIKSDNLDLFGLGFQEVAPKSKESSEDQDDRESRSSTKDKKKKKKKSKEEDDKSSKKRHKQKKKEESGSGDEKEKKKNKSKSTKKAGGVVDDLESFLAGDEDYEEM